MKITSYEATALNIPETDPLANMEEEKGRTRPVVILRLRTDSGIEGIAVTFYGGKMTGSLRVAVEELSALTGSKHEGIDGATKSAIRELIELFEGKAD